MNEGSDAQNTRGRSCDGSTFHVKLCELWWRWVYCAGILILCSYFCHRVGVVLNVHVAELSTKCTLLVTSSSDSNFLFWGANEQRSDSKYTYHSTHLPGTSNVDTTLPRLVPTSTRTTCTPVPVIIPGLQSPRTQYVIVPGTRYWTAFHR